MRSPKPAPSTWGWTTNQQTFKGPCLGSQEWESQEVTAAAAVVAASAVAAVAAVVAAAAAAAAPLDASRRRSSAKVKQTAAPAESMRGRAHGCLLWQHDVGRWVGNAEGTPAASGGAP